MRKQGERVVHNVRKNESTRLPRRYIFIDTEARKQRMGVAEKQTWRLAVACFVVAEKGDTPRERWQDFSLPRALWNAVEAHTRPGTRTVLWAHNLGYDVRISGALSILPEMGWRLTAHNITSRGTWLEWRKASATLIMVDSTTVFARPIAKIGAWFGLGKVRMEHDTDDDALWLERCRRDVEILKTAIMSYLSWIEEDDLGNWQMTGSGQSWATFRHRFLTHKMVVHDDETALIAERRAMWTGRCEAYWHGALQGQTVQEWDFTQAYARIARDSPIPVRLIGPMPVRYDWKRVVESETTALLAEVEIETSVPVVPASKNGRILWPVGRFTTTLWDVEIAAALKVGAKVTVIRGWLYRLQPALKAWAEWTIGKLGDTDSRVPAWQKAVLKHWSRALIGRTAMTYSSWEEWAESPVQKVEKSRLYDMETGEEYDLMQIGNTIWQDVGRVESPNSMPMVAGYVQAIARVQLWDVMQALPPRVLLYVDTDSLLVTSRHFDVVNEIAHSITGGSLRLKRSWDGFSIYGPRQIITGERVRVSGVPTTANRSGKNSYRGEIWDTLAGSLGRGHSDSVTTRGREWHVTGTDHRRHGVGIGWTEPIMVS